MVNIKVAVRIRPLSEREVRNGEEIIVRKESKSVLVTNPKIPERQDGDSRQRTRRFTVDFCYDPSDPEGSSQEAVYKEIGSEVVHSMYEGYNACVLAYGHSASGKTYTIMGLQSDPGLTPRVCEGLFDKLKREFPEGRIQVQIVISFLEIYNEKVRDLLGSEETGATGGNFSLRVREHPKLGPYVQGLSAHSVADKRELLELLTTGNRRRSTAATESNIHSSRSHAVFTILLKQSDGENYETEKSSKVHLVDLAGSERARASQSKARLQEGANINKSLATLGNVICALAESYDSGTPAKDHSTSKTWQPFVPYRDSVLTWLLKDTLGGNSNTIMIATISPASGCISETVNTLRYAKRAKKIVNQAIVNEDPKIRTIRELRNEIARLKALLIFFRSCGRVVDPWDGNAQAATEPSPGENSVTHSFCTDFFIDLHFEGNWVFVRLAIQLGGLRGSPRREEISRPHGMHKCLLLGAAVRRDVGCLPRDLSAFWRPPSGSQKQEGRRQRINEESCWKKEISGVKSANKDTEVTQDKGREEKSPRKKESGAGDRRSGTGLSGGAACEFGAEKKSDVNGSVNDNFSHETQFFSDSLESFSSLFLKSGNVCDAVDDGSGQPGAADDDELENRMPGAQIPSLNSTRNFGSDENLSKEAFPEMLHRSRPDLIKGISTRTQDNGLPLGSSHSCADVSNLSQSTSENSLNSSGSAEVQSSESRSSQKPRAYNLARTEKREREGTGKNGAGNEALEATSKKKEKRLEVVTNRLYAAKKKPDHKAEVPKREDNEDDCGDLDELKLCKRARMKLFDLSRKLAMSRKMKKTVDSDTQTDSVTGTLRVKEKCVTTEPSAAAAEVAAREDKKPYVIMNQVFIPRASNYVVECGKVVRVEGPEAPPRHESATQTSGADRRRRRADTSPVEFSPGEEDCFSEDSLDLEVKSPSRREMCSGEDQTRSDHLAPETRMKWKRAPGHFEVLSRDSEQRLTEESIAESSKEPTKSGDALFDGLFFPAFIEEGINSGEQVAFFMAHPPCDSRKGENISSENSFTSTESTENNSSSETASEDFVFYVNPKDLLNKSKATSERELYTITENSEQSDPGDAFSPVQRQHPSFEVREDEEEVREWAENPGRRLRGSSVPRDGKKEELWSFGRATEARERTSSPDGGKLRWNEVRTGASGENRDQILHRVKMISDSHKMTTDSPKVPKPQSSPPTATDPENTHGLPNTKTANRFPEDFTTGKPCCSGEGDGRAKRTYGTDFQLKPQKQYLNLNISSSSGTPPFSVDTQLFGKAPKGDRSTDTMSTSADSITFVFMGPAKPKTSVLMEIIGRSLGRSSLESEAAFASRKSRSRGIQCDPGLMRSVSVDTAMIALSRIARNQETSPEMQRTTSLGKLDPEDALAVLGGRNHRSQPWRGRRCGPETGGPNGETKKRVLQCSVGTSTVCDVDNAGKNKNPEAEKPKKSVSWFGEMEAERVRMVCGDNRNLSEEQPDFGRGSRDCPEEGTDPTPLPTSADSDLPERRVRFVKPENTDTFGETTEPGCRGANRLSESTGDLAAFLKEATRLLKNLNSRSSKQQVFSEEAGEELGSESSRKKEENRLCGYKGTKKTEGLTKGGVQSFPEKDSSWRWRGSGRQDESQMNLTWPRRRPTTGKPPTGTRAKFPRSLHSHGLPSSTSNLRGWSQGSRMGSNGQSWNLSNLSVALGNSCFGENESRPPSSRSSYCNEMNLRRDFGSPPGTSPKWTIHPRSNIDSISDLETDLEECCRRLEMATEQDKARGKVHERQRSGFEWRRDEDGQTENRSPRAVFSRRRTEGCLGRCACGSPGREPCRRLWSRGCRSTFELDTFGPGSRHCSQLCMFCRKKEAEIYYSAVNLNSECSSGLCRLNYYGFCPCSPVKLNQVAPSPRAYMQRLLALRKQIVSDAKPSELDGRHVPHRNWFGLSRRGRPELSVAQNFS